MGSFPLLHHVTLLVVAAFLLGPSPGVTAAAAAAEGRPRHAAFAPPRRPNTCVELQKQNAVLPSFILFQANDDESSSSSFWNGISNDLQMRYRIFQESQKGGDTIKQSMANVLAGEYDEDSVRRNIEQQIASAPCVMYTWERSPSCIQAKKAMELMGILDQVSEIPLDKPWDQGHPIRAELGKMVGRSSVPAIFIDGKYVGGFDGGVSTDSPGIQAMAFQGTLRPALTAAGIQFPKET